MESRLPLGVLLWMSVGLLAAEKSIERPQAFDVVLNGDFALHGDVDDAHALTFAHLLQHAGVARHAHHLEVVAQEAQLAFEQAVQADVGGCDAEKLLHGSVLVRRFFGFIK